MKNTPSKDSVKFTVQDITKRENGEWERIPYSFVGGYRCSLCGCKSESNCWNFCPDCGAKMHRK